MQAVLQRTVWLLPRATYSMMDLLKSVHWACLPMKGEKNLCLLPRWGSLVPRLLIISSRGRLRCLEDALVKFEGHERGGKGSIVKKLLSIKEELFNECRPISPLRQPSACLATVEVWHSKLGEASSTSSHQIPLYAAGSTLLWGFRVGCRESYDCY